jgi:hypothetical protein
MEKNENNVEFFFLSQPLARAEKKTRKFIISPFFYVLRISRASHSFFLVPS